MEYCVHHHASFALPSSCSSSSVLPKFRSTYLCARPVRFLSNSLFGPIRSRDDRHRRRGVRVMASAGASHCGFNSLNANSPLQVQTLEGKNLSGVLQNHRQFFHISVEEELRLLSDDREESVARMILSEGSDEALLHRRIAEVKEDQRQTILQDILYLLISYKFSEIRVPFVPKLSRCICNGRLEILPSKDWQLESIHSLGVLDLIREHVTTVTGLSANPSVKEIWSTTKIRYFILVRIYVASILYGYFLKSASLRYHLERSLSLGFDDLCVSHGTAISVNNTSHYRLKDLIFGRSNLQSVGQGQAREEEKIKDMKYYVIGFQYHPGSLQRCARLRSREAATLVENYSCALFGNMVGSDDVILTSFSSLKRLVLEAVAFGSFIWEAEDYIDVLYNLKDI